ncbi:MAG: twin-arginine translocation signal domain-containing protein, partial [Deltaproteobacteria bacterium]|nr:twin-arginine translocation signal domain-containing protein [Deltaproteobacteria bacterium]
MQIKRRDFLKLSAAAGVSTAVFRGATLNAFAESKGGEIEGEAPGEWKPTTCQGCTTWC